MCDDDDDIFCSTKVEFDRDSRTQKQLVDTVDHAKVRLAWSWDFLLFKNRNDECFFFSGEANFCLVYEVINLDPCFGWVAHELW